MKSTPSVKPKIIKKLSANEQELNAGKINTKTAVKKVQKAKMISTNFAFDKHFFVCPFSHFGFNFPGFARHFKQHECNNETGFKGIRVFYFVL